MSGGLAFAHCNLLSQESSILKVTMALADKGSGAHRTDGLIGTVVYYLDQSIVYELQEAPHVQLQLMSWSAALWVFPKFSHMQYVAMLQII